MSEFYTPKMGKHFDEVAGLTSRVVVQHPDAVDWAVCHAAAWHDAIVAANAASARYDALWSVVQAHHHLVTIYFGTDADAGQQADEVITAALYLYRNSDRFAQSIRVRQVDEGEFTGQYRVVITDGFRLLDIPLPPLTGDHQPAPVLYTYRLPTTGYVVLHQVHTDGEQPYTATVFIDSANVMDDGRAIAYAQDEHASLRNAPGNVVHTLRLVHRTQAGDRDLWVGEPVRGTGPPLS